MKTLARSRCQGRERASRFISGGRDIAERLRELLGALKSSQTHAF
jgi:hypothetical protein